MLIVLMPCALRRLFLVARFSTWASVLVGPLIALGLPYWLAQTGRDRGKRKEEGLYAFWVESPALSSYAIATPRSTPTRKDVTTPPGKRCCPQSSSQMLPKRLLILLQRIQFYEAFGDFLRERTRDTKKCRLVFEELMKLWISPQSLGMESGRYNAVQRCTGNIDWFCLSGLPTHGRYLRHCWLGQRLSTSVILGLLALLGRPSLGQDRR